MELGGAFRAIEQATKVLSAAESVGTIESMERIFEDRNGVLKHLGSGMIMDFYENPFLNEVVKMTQTFSEPIYEVMRSYEEVMKMAEVVSGPLNFIQSFPQEEAVLAFETIQIAKSFSEAIDSIEYGRIGDSALDGSYELEVEVVQAIKQIGETKSWKENRILNNSIRQSAQRYTLMTAFMAAGGVLVNIGAELYSIANEMVINHPVLVGVGLKLLKKLKGSKAGLHLKDNNFRVVVSKCKIHSSGSLRSSEIGLLNRGEIVEVLDVKGEWKRVKIELEGIWIDGWVKSLSIKN